VTPGLTTFRFTHPFHPLLGRQFEIVDLRESWGHGRVYFRNDEGDLSSVRTSWTDLAAPDPFVALAQGRVLMRTTDLVRLASLLRDLEIGDV
jgi:hypothetical protein